TGAASPSGPGSTASSTGPATSASCGSRASRPRPRGTWRPTPPTRPAHTVGDAGTGRDLSAPDPAPAAGSVGVLGPDSSAGSGCDGEGPHDPLRLRAPGPPHGPGAELAGPARGAPAARGGGPRRRPGHRRTDRDLAGGDRHRLRTLPARRRVGPRGEGG